MTELVSHPRCRLNITRVNNDETKLTIYGFNYEIVSAVKKLPMAGNRTALENNAMRGLQIDILNMERAILQCEFLGNELFKESTSNQQMIDEETEKIIEEYSFVKDSMKMACNSNQIKALIVVGDKMADLIQYSGIEKNEFSKMQWRTLLVNARLVCLDLLMIKFEVKLSFGLDNFEIGADRVLNRIKTFRDMYLRADMVIRIDELVGILPTVREGKFCTEDMFQSKKFTRGDTTAFIIKGEFITFTDEKNAKIFDKTKNEEFAAEFCNDRSDRIKRLALEFKAKNGMELQNTQFFWNALNDDKLDDTENHIIPEKLQMLQGPRKRDTIIYDLYKQLDL